MKTSDYVTVVFIAVFVTIISYFAVNSFLGDPKELSVKFEYLNSTSTQLASPNKDIFNAGAINPTVEVYVGSCVDQDQNGILSEEEKVACGQDAMRTDTGQTESDYLQENNGLSNEENNTINANDVNQYRENQGNTNTQNAAENAARQETVSGS